MKIIWTILGLLTAYYGPLLVAYTIQYFKPYSRKVK
jgi:hypothetical protein